MSSARPPSFEDCHCFAVRKAARRISRFYDDRLRPSGLRSTQFLMLAALDELGGAAVNDLAERLDIERTAMGKMLATLERARKVSVRRSPCDGRSRLVELTDEGRASLRDSFPLWLAAQRDFERIHGLGGAGALRDESASAAPGAR